MTVQEQQLTPAEAYEQYFGPAIFEPLARVVVDAAAPRAGERVLDLACGTGIVARRVASMLGEAGRVVGVDVNPGMLDVARAQPPPGGAPIAWRDGDATALDVAAAAFDLVICQQGLQFFPDRRAGAREMRRVLAEGGRAVVAVWRGLDRHPLYEAVTEAELPHLEEYGVPVTRDELQAPFSLGDADELRALLASAGFRRVDVASRSIQARFATPERFVERLEYAYAAVVPEFTQNPAAFAAYLAKVDQQTRAVVERYRDGDRVVVPMHTWVAVARP